MAGKGQLEGIAPREVPPSAISRLPAATIIRYYTVPRPAAVPDGSRERQGALLLEAHDKIKDRGMKKLMMLAMAAILFAALPLMASTEQVGNYRWTYRVNGNTAEV